MPLIVGCGYVGRRLAVRLHEQGDPVTGLVRTHESAGQLRAAGIEAVQADLDEPLPALPTGGSRVFYLAPPPSRGDRDPRLGRFLEACAGDRRPGRILYVSTTGVYGDCRGEWVDESRPVAPAAARSRRRWDAEQRLRGWSRATGGETVVLRVAGIYGPGKLPLERLRQGAPMVSERDAPWTNRIHVDDLVGVLLAAMDRAPDGGLYNVSDGRPGNMRDYFDRLADLTGLPRPPAIDPADAEQRLSAGMLSYLRESRRLSNRKMIDELGVTLNYPDLDTGLPASLD